MGSAWQRLWATVSAGAREGGCASAGTGRAEEGAKRAGALVARSCGADWAGAARGLEQARGRGKKKWATGESGVGWEVRFGLGFSSFLILFTLSFLFLIQTKFEFKFKI